MLDANIIRPSRSPWSFPIVIVDKKKNTLDANKQDKLEKRFCVDFRQLNKITKPIAYPLPLIDDILALLGKVLQKVLSLLLRNGRTTYKSHQKNMSHLYGQNNAKIAFYN